MVYDAILECKSPTCKNMVHKNLTDYLKLEKKYNFIIWLINKMWQLCVF